jgi:polysaccharide chain length determinant protein (PEP-CTERM system associated)
LQGEEPTLAGMPDLGGASTSVDEQIAEYKLKLEGLLVGYTEKHPEVVGLRETIARLEAQRAEEAAGSSGKGSGGVNQLNINPVYQSMRIALSQTELDLVETRNKLNTEEANVAKLKSLVSTIPEIEAELVRLNRDYEVNRAQHQGLLRSLETARISNDAATSKRGTRFRVIEPPVVPLEPVSPNRFVFDAMVLFAACGVGLALAFLLHQLNPVFNTRQDLEAQVGLPVLGSIAYAPSPAEARAARWQPWLVGATAGMLLIAFVAVAGLGILFPNGLAHVVGS